MYKQKHILQEQKWEGCDSCGTSSSPKKPVAEIKVDYKKRAWSNIVANADLQLSAGTCPLIEDEAIVWADKRIQELEELNRKMHVQVSGYLSGDDWSHWQKFNQHKFTQK